MTTGWLCPLCSGAHGPHVDTCPVGSAASPPQARKHPADCGCYGVHGCLKAGCPRTTGTVYLASPVSGGTRVRCEACDLGQSCGSIACPYRAEVTCAAA
jgi:hypothetical protein